MTSSPAGTTSKPDATPTSLSSSLGLFSIGIYPNDYLFNVIAAVFVAVSFSLSAEGPRTIATLELSLKIPLRILLFLARSSVRRYVSLALSLNTFSGLLALAGECCMTTLDV